MYANSEKRPVEITLLNIWFVGQVWLRHLIVDQEITGSNPVRIALEDFLEVALEKFFLKGSWCKLDNQVHSAPQ